MDTMETKARSLISAGMRVIAGTYRGQRLKAPPEIASHAAQLRELARRQLNVLQGLTVAGKAGDLRRVQRLASINQQLNEQAAQVARDLKARSCAS